MMALSVLVGPVFWVQETVVDPEPVPLSGETVIHDPLPAAVQLPPTHPAGAPVIVTTCDPGSAPGFAEVGEIEKLVHVCCMPRNSAPTLRGAVIVTLQAPVPEQESDQPPSRQDCPVNRWPPAPWIT